MIGSRLVNGTLLSLAVAVVAFMFVSSYSAQEQLTVSSTEAFSFLATDGLILPQQATNACSNYTPGTACTATSIGTRICAARNGGACGCSCADTTNPRWICGVCTSGQCDSNNQKCGKSTPAAGIIDVEPK